MRTLIGLVIWLLPSLAHATACLDYLQADKNYADQYTARTQHYPPSTDTYISEPEKWEICFGLHQVFPLAAQDCWKIIPSWVHQLVAARDTAYIDIYTGDRDLSEYDREILLQLAKQQRDNMCPN